MRLVPGANEVEPTMRSTAVESVLRDSGFVEQRLFQHKPPVLALLRELLEARNHRAPIEALRPSVMEQVELWCSHVEAGELASRKENFRIYRRLLAAAWGSDLQIDASERTLLGLLRREIGMEVVEHFLISHHSEIQPYWRDGDVFERCLQALLDDGVLFRVADDVLIPEEFVHRVQRALGLQISRGAALRLLDHMSNENLKAALERYEIRTSGDKAQRIARLINELVPMTEVLAATGIFELRDIARETGAAVTGSKAELAARLLAHFEDGKDLATDDASGPEVVEPKSLAKPRFHKLLTPLTGHQLEVLCRRHDLHHTGTKDHRIETLWESPFAEQTLLRALRNPDLVELCREHGLDSSGGKDTMVERLLKHVGEH